MSTPGAADPDSDAGPGGGFSITTRRPVAILMVVMAVCVFGWVSYQRLSLDLMPDIAYPTLTVRTEYPGTAPEEVETLISRPLERELGIVPHLVRISSVSKAGQSDVILEFEWDTDMNEVSQDIREKVDRTFLPEDAEKPLLLRYDPSLDPILRLGLYGDEAIGGGLFELRELADEDIRRELESVPGVAAVKVKGGLEEEIHVSLQERRMALLGLDAGAINRRLDQANVNLPGGQLREGQTEYLVRTLNEFKSLEEIGDLIIAQEGGADIRLRDVAQIERAHRDREILTRVNGRESVELEIYKEADANIVAVALAVRERLTGTAEQQAYVAGLTATPDTAAAGEAEEAKEEAAAEAADADGDEDMKSRKKADAVRTMQHLRMTDFISFRLPAGAHIELLSDQSVFIENSISEVQKSALLGGLMAVLVLLVFLRNIVHTLIVAITIPVSVVATFAPMYLFDVSLNIMSLGGLALGVGMLVDNSIVVLESIFRCREEGDDLITATVRGTGEVGGAVFASTLTTIAVFFPIVFVEGVAGQVFGDMALTVVFSLLASLAVALYFIPMLASRQARRDGFAEIVRSPYLRLPAAKRVRIALRAEAAEPTAERLRQAALVLPQLAADVLYRVGLALAAILAAAVKTVGLLLFEALFFVWIPLRFWRPARFGTTHERVAAWAATTPVWRGFPDSVWAGLLDNGAAESIARDLSRLWPWIAPGPPRSGLIGRLCWPLSILRAGLCVLVLPYMAVRLVLHMVLSLVRSIVLTALLFAGLTVAAALVLASIVVVPVAAPVLWLFQRLIEMVQQVYPVVLRAALRQRLVVVAGAAVSFWLCWSQLLPALGTELIPPVHQGEFSLELAMPVGTPLNRTAAVAATAEAVATALDRVERVATTVGSDGTATSSSEEGEHTARVTVYLQSGTTPDAEDQVIEQLRQRLRALPEVTTEVSYPSLFSFKTPIELEVRGDELQTLRRVSADAVTVLAGLPGLADVRSTLQVGHPELQVVYDRQRLSDYGLDLRGVAELVRNKVQGRVATDFRREERNIDVLVRLQEIDRLGVDELEGLVVNPNGTVPITLASVAGIRIAEGPSEIRRIDQQRAALVTANTEGIDLGSASKSIETALAGMSVPAGFTFLISGQNEEMERSLESMVFALCLAIFLVYIVMASQFESLIHPFVIMFTVPLAAIGAVAALFVAHTPLSIVVFIGFIMLAGIVVNNAIVLVDYINTLRRSGMDPTQAIVQAGSVRLRPILMTTMTTVLGLLPMALGLGDGAEIRTPMALTVIAGLVSSTFLTLVVIPTVYSLAVRR